MTRRFNHPAPRRNPRFGRPMFTGFEIFVGLIIIVIAVIALINLVGALANGNICDAYPSWTPVKDIPAGCLKEVINR